MFLKPKIKAYSIADTLMLLHKQIWGLGNPHMLGVGKLNEGNFVFFSRSSKAFVDGFLEPFRFLFIKHISDK